MDNNFLRSLAANWGQEESEGLNPRYLPDLISMSQTHLGQSVASFRTLILHFESMRQRMMEAQNTMSGLLGKRGSIPEELYETAIENKHCFHDTELAIDDLLALADNEEAESYWEALGQLEEASKNLEAATEELARVARAHQ